MIKFDSRKFIAAIVLFITSTIFVAIGKATFAEFTSFMTYVLTIYSAANVGDKFMEKRNAGEEK